MKHSSFYSLADSVCRGYTLTRVTHDLDRDLVPLIPLTFQLASS
jgi:hypothetical protein